MYRIKRTLSVILLYLFFSVLYAQEKENVYLYFDINSKETYKTPKEGGGYSDFKKFQKIKQKNNDIDFYIYKELFSFKGNLKPDTCNVKQIEKIKISKIEDLKKTVDRVNGLYPYKVFPNLYVVEKLTESTIVKYAVKWEYYIN